MLGIWSRVIYKLSHKYGIVIVALKYMTQMSSLLEQYE